MDVLEAALDQVGFAVIEDALDVAELASLTDAVDDFHRRRGGGTLHELGFLGADERFAELVDHPAVLPVVVATLGWNVFMYQWHARGDNTSDVTRKVLFFAYTYRWIRPRDDLDLSASFLAGTSPTRRQLLGDGTSAIGHWIPTEEDVPLRAAVEA